ncbi:MAG TPA: zinc ribbon domain-containing protein [Pyrinomonadaceae bacterium]|nr:zinc ribbon domain-containing protein [Pyrinomonadaceae bacterium]
MLTRQSKRAATALFLLLIGLPANLPAQQTASPPAHTHSAVVTKTVDLGSFVKEIMALKIEGETQHLGLWFPYEFFVAAGMSDGKTTRASAESDVAFIKPFITIAVQVNRDLPDGTSIYQTESEVRSRAVLKLDDGSEIAPLDKVPPMLTAALAAMKSIIAQQGGEDRASTFFLVFPNKAKTGKPAVDERQRDKLTLLFKADKNFRETVFTWRTPFDAVSSVPDCPKCKAGLSAKWTYCPYCGQKISN